MASRKPALVGRRAELEAIEEALAALDDQHAGGVVELAGEPGIGKTRLLDELRALAHRRGHLVLSGRAAEFEGELPFGVFVDALDDYLASLDPERLEALAGRAAPLLAVAFPAFEQLAAGSEPVLTEERFRTHRAVRTLLSRLAERQPLVLVLDDVHWADAGSAEMLCHLLAHPPVGAVLVVVAFRPAQVTGRLAAVLAASLRLEEARRLDLEPLAPAEAQELLGPAVSIPLRDRLYLESGGNPFYLQELARDAARPSERPLQASDGEPNVPEAVRTALRSEIGSLPVSTQVLLQGAAVAGDPFDEDLAVLAADIGTEEALQGLDDLLHAGIISPTPTPRRFAFRHPILRAAAYDCAGRSWVVRAHARIADAMAKRGEAASARAHHIARSASKGDLVAVAALTEAGDTIASRVPAAAAEWYRAASRLLPETVEAVPQRISLLIATATALGSSGSLEESAEALGEVLDLLPSGEPARAGVVAYCAGVEHLLGRHSQARARLREAYHGLVEPGSREGVALAIELSGSCAYESSAEEGRSWAQKALDGSRALGDRPMEAVAAALLSYFGYAQGLPADPELAVAADLTMALDDTLLATRLDLPIYLCFTEAQFERFEEAIALCERAARVSRATGQGAYLAGTMTAKAYALMLSGRLTEAKQVIDGVIEAFRLSPNVFLAEATAFAAMVASWTGDNEAALRWGEESVELARLQEPGVIPAVAGLALAVALVEVGQFERAKAIVFEMCGGEELTRMMRACRVIVYEALTQVDLALDRPEAAKHWAAAAMATTHGGALAVEFAFAARAQALVLAAAGDHGAAAELALSAAEGAEAAGSPVEASRCLILAGRTLAQVGERDRAVALLEQAEERLTFSGAFGFRDQAQKELRRLGRRVTRRAGPLRLDDGLRALTERERELAVLVAQGLTNRQIAASAYLSEKTVERHLSHIFAKLGVSGRAGLAAIVAADSGSA